MSFAQLAVARWSWKKDTLRFYGSSRRKNCVVIIDAFSKWLYVKHMSHITTNSMIKVLLKYFSLWGIPDKIVTDNGPSLCSQEMECFLKNKGVLHIKVSPYNPSSNGAAENAVRTSKNFYKKCKNKGDVDIDIFNFYYHTTAQNNVPLMLVLRSCTLVEHLILL